MSSPAPATAVAPAALTRPRRPRRAARGARPASWPGPPRARPCGSKPEQALGLGEVGHAVPDVLVVAADLLEPDVLDAQRALDAHGLLDLAGELDDLDRLVVADVDDLAGGLRTRQGADDAVDRVAHVGERAGLAAVAVDLHVLAVEQVLEEDRQRAAPPRRVVADAVGVEEPQDRDLQALLLGHPQRQVLVVVLRRGVRPAAGRRRAEHDRVVLVERRLGLAVDVRRRGQHHVGADLAAELERDVRAVDVDGQRLQRPAVARDLERRHVGDRVDSRPSPRACARRHGSRTASKRKFGWSMHARQVAAACPSTCRRRR